MSKISITGVICLFLGFIAFGEAKTQDICPYLQLACPCGNQGYNITLKQKQCRIHVSPLGRVCSPCTGKVLSEICSQFKSCKQCESNVEECTECPDNKYGPFCTEGLEDKNHVLNQRSVKKDCSTASGKWPWFAAIGRWLPQKNQTNIQCGGALISNYQVLTAAHCVLNSLGIHPDDPSNFDIYLGKKYFDFDLDDEHVQVKEVKHIHIHPNFNRRTYDFDIAVIDMKSPVKFSSNVAPVNLPTLIRSQENLIPGNTGRVVSWGLSIGDDDDDKSKSTKEFVIPLVSRDTCKKSYKRFNVGLSDNMLCGSFIGKNEPCYGDAGNPLVFKYENNKCTRWVVEGLVSWGSTNCGIQGQFTVYTKVINFVDWIKSLD